jgi:glycosyltransferase involved in cell wall biosynthesis
MRVLVYDSEAGGHHREYFRYLREYWAQAGTEGHLYFATHPDVADEMQGDVPPTCTVLPLDRATVDELENTQQAWRRSLKEWNAMEEMAQQCDPDHCVISTLNWFQLSLALPRAYRVPYTVSGILFFPYPRLEPDTDRWSHVLSYVARRFRKWALLWLMMRNPRITNVYVFNDPEAADHLNQYVDTRSRFRSLPDPAPKLPSPPATADLRGLYDINESRTLFLFFGTISRRKGIFQALRALHKLDPSECKQVALLIAGRPKDHQEDVIRRVASDASRLDHLQVRTDFRFLEPQELALALRDSDVILAPYQRTEGSSGVIGHAARWEIPIIGSASGLIGDLIRRYNLGRTVDATSPKEIGTAMVRSLKEGGLEASVSGMRRYVREHTPGSFSRQLLSRDGKN